MKKYICLICIAIIVICCTSCQNVFGRKTDSSLVYGSWLYTRDNGSGIRLELTPDGRYSYEEFYSNGKVSFSYEGKYSLSDTRLILKGLDEEDEDRYSIFALSMSVNENGSDVLSLVPKMTAKYDFVRVGKAVPKVAAESGKPTVLDGTWVNKDFGSVIIKSGTLTLNSIDGNTYSAKIDMPGDGVLKLDFANDALSGYETISYFILNNSLYVVFSDISSDAVVFSKSM